MRETRLSGSEGGGDDHNRLSLPLSTVTRRTSDSRYRSTPESITRPSRSIVSNRTTSPAIVNST